MSDSNSCQARVELETKSMTITGINTILNTVQVFTGWGHYTCPTKMVDGKQFFLFKKEWREVAKYVTEYTHVFKG